MGTLYTEYEAKTASGAIEFDAAQAEVARLLDDLGLCGVKLYGAAGRFSFV